MDAIVLLARILFALSLFLIGYDNVTQASSKADHAAQKGLIGANVLVPLAGLILIAGCISIILGFYGEIGAVLVLTFLLPVTLVMHAYWRIDDTKERKGQRIHFYKNMALAGGALLIVAYGTGPLSLTQPVWP